MISICASTRPESRTGVLKITTLSKFCILELIRSVHFPTSKTLSKKFLKTVLQTPSLRPNNVESLQRFASLRGMLQVGRYVDFV